MEKARLDFKYELDEMVKALELIIQRTNNRVLVALFIGFIIGYVAGFITAFAFLYWIGQVIVGWIKVIKG